MSFPDWQDLAGFTADKIHVEATKQEPNLRHLVLLCNTFDKRMSHYPYDPLSDDMADDVDDYDENEAPPQYDLYSSPGTITSAEECDSSSESDSFSISGDETNQQLGVMTVESDEKEASDNRTATKVTQTIQLNDRSHPEYDRYVSLGVWSWKRLLRIRIPLTCFQPS